MLYKQLKVEYTYYPMFHFEKDVTQVLFPSGVWCRLFFVFNLVAVLDGLYVWGEVSEVFDLESTCRKDFRFLIL